MEIRYVNGGKWHQPVLDCRMVRFVPKDDADNATDYTASAFNVGDDIVFIGRDDLVAGTLEIVVLGYTLTSDYNLHVELVTAQRELRPMAAIALGEVCFPPLKLLQDTKVIFVYHDSCRNPTEWIDLISNLANRHNLTIMMGLV